MNQMVQGFLDNDSFFGRFMTKLGIIIAANIMFMLLSIPFLPSGPGFQPFIMSCSGLCGVTGA